MSELQRLIEERKKEAQDKRIQHKAEMIARHLGEDEKESGGIGESWTYEDLLVTVRYQKDYATSDEGIASSSTSIETEKRWVFHYDGDKKPPPNGGEWQVVGVTRYVPGEWETVLDSLYHRALPAAQAVRQTEATARRTDIDAAEKDERTKWGL